MNFQSRLVLSVVVHFVWHLGQVVADAFAHWDGDFFAATTWKKNGRVGSLGLKANWQLTLEQRAVAHSYIPNNLNKSGRNLYLFGTYDMNVRAVLQPWLRIPPLVFGLSENLFSYCVHCIVLNMLRKGITLAMYKN
jgi:hypothetical protein